MPAWTSSIDAPSGAKVVREDDGRSRSNLAISSSVRRRSFSSRTSRPRLWQYQKTKRRTVYGGCVSECQD